MTPTSGLESNWTAITLVALLLVCCVPLYYSMRHQMRRIKVPTQAEWNAQIRRSVEAQSGNDKPPPS